VCPPDCGQCRPICGDGVCGVGENCEICPADCGVCTLGCGDGTCGIDESCASCPVDCGGCSVVCGNAVCESGEDCTSCPSDCGTCGVVCGDAVCESGEDCTSCPSDCGACPPVCGDGTCNAGEACDVCVSDCGVCPPVCGDDVCEGNEDVYTCLNDCYDWPASYAALEQQILEQLNVFRSQSQTCGGTSYPAVPPLTMNAELRLAARLHSQDMADQNFFDHDSLDGRTFMDRINDAGFTGGCPCGENIAAGSSTASATMTQWINSPGHCSNMMGSGYTTVGIGYGYNASSSYGHYWTQDFGN
jgi:uncharacterized protein YkwD